MSSPANVRRISVLGGYLWLALSFLLFFIAFLAVPVSPAALVYAVLAVGPLIFVAILFARRPSLPAFIASTVAGSLSTLAGIMAISEPGGVPVALPLAFTICSLGATVVSATGARFASRGR
jgi:hypothetical protein